jgi:hypothetical protein
MAEQIRSITVPIRVVIDTNKQTYSGEFDDWDEPAVHISFWSSWLTAKGKWVLWALKTVGLDKLDERMDEHGYPHFDGKGTCADCTEDCWHIPEVTEEPHVQSHGSDCAYLPSPDGPLEAP